MEANDIIMRIARTIAPESFEEDRSEGYTSGKSAYYSSDLGVVTRVTNHKAYHRTFQQRATKFGLPSRIISIVFEDESTQGNDVLYKPIRKPFTIHEYVYPLWMDGHSLEQWEVDKIIKAIIQSGEGTFNDPVEKQYIHLGNLKIHH